MRAEAKDANQHAPGYLLQIAKTETNNVTKNDKQKIEQTLWDQEEKLDGTKRMRKTQQPVSNYK